MTPLMQESLTTRHGAWRDQLLRRAYGCCLPSALWLELELPLKDAAR
jgi:hypothetical protein